MHTARFSKIRRESLKHLLDTKFIVQTWRTTVWRQLRDADVSDIFDYYDFAYNIRERARSLRSAVLDGSYSTASPLIYKLEKKFGVCRHMVIPHPPDALLLQVIAERLAPAILQKQPSKNSFFSRDNHKPFEPHESDTYGIGTIDQWIKLQKEIFNFSKSKKFLVVTDLANYYDSIDLSELRKVVSSQAGVDEELLDLLFHLVEGVAWKPDYLPYARRGLPTTNLEAIRLLAHAYLFEIDLVLEKECKGAFARWMDDFTIGVASTARASEILGTVSDMLKSRGLSLNLAKTEVLTQAEASEAFQFEMHKKINSWQGQYDAILMQSGNAGPQLSKLESLVYKEFQAHLESHPTKHSDKISKRFITLLKKLKSKNLLKKTQALYIQYPALRQNLRMHLIAMGYSTRNIQKIAGILQKVGSADDLSRFQLVKVIAAWRIPERISTTSQNAMAQIMSLLKARALKSSENDLSFHALLWFSCKYSTSAELLSFVTKFQNLWQSNTFIRRQVTAVLARLLHFRSARRILKAQLVSGVSRVFSVASQIEQFASLKAITFRLRAYLFPEIKHTIYPLHKFLVICALLNSARVRQDEDFLALIKMHVIDPYYLRWLREVYLAKAT